MKLVFDYFVALIGLILFAPIILIVALLIKIESNGPIFYRQIRVGKDHKHFKIHKLRSMYVPSALKVDDNDEKKSISLTAGISDSRITKVGKWIRKLHLDEIVQLIDVLQGNMSIVGPRPEVPEYTKIYEEKWGKVLKVKPGITGAAAIKLSTWEYEILTNAQNCEEAYVTIILPKKLEIELQYIKERSFFTDMKIIFNTLKMLFSSVL